MAQYWYQGHIIDDQDRGVPEGATRVPTYQNRAQYGDAGFAWDPANRFFSGTDLQTSAPGYLPELLARLDRRERGQLKPYEAGDLGQWEATARAMPTRDIATLTAGWQGDPGSQDWWTRLDPGSPDAGPVMLALRDKVQAGTATPQEQALFGQVRAMGEDWDYRASAPQESDAQPFGLGDNLFGALMTLGLGATGGLAGGALAAGAGGLGSTLGSLGTLAGNAGQIGGMLGQATGQDWLANAGRYLGAAGGIAGGLGGLSTLWGTGLHSLGDAARLASSAGRVVGGIGTLSDSDVLRQAGGYLGAAGQLGAGAETIADVFGGGVKDLTDAARLASGLGQIGGAVGRVTGNRPLQQVAGLLGMGSRLGGGVGNLLGAAQQAQQRGMQPGVPVPRTMTDQDWLAQQWQPGPWQQPQSTLWNL